MLLMLNHSNITKNAFLNVPNSNKWGILTIFLTWVHRIDLILLILIQLNGVHDLTIISLMLDQSKTSKMPLWMIQIAEHEVFGHFLELGASDRLQIAYYDCTK